MCLCGTRTLSVSQKCVHVGQRHIVKILMCPCGTKAHSENSASNNDKMHKENGIVLSEIFGYDSVGSTDQADSGLLMNHTFCSHIHAQVIIIIITLNFLQIIHHHGC